MEPGVLGHDSHHRRTFASRLPRDPATVGFTLIELVLVIVILGALSTIIAATYRDREFDSQVNTMRSVVRTVRARIKQHHAETGEYPPTIDATWFSAPLTNVFSDSANADQVFVTNHASYIYPANKTFNDGSGFSLWYNRGNGAFCARVPPQGGVAANLALFNRVNLTEVTSTGQRF